MIMEYYRHIDRTKVQFDFICDSDSNGIPREEIESLGGRIYIVPPYKHIFSHMIETYKVLRKNKYQIMHAFDNTLNLFPMFVGWCAGVRVRVSESISKGDRNEKKTMVKYFLRLFSHCFATDYMANSIDCGKWQFGEKTYKDGKVHIFKTVINATENAYIPSLRESTRTKFGWNNNVVYGFIGRYVSQKNPLFLMDVFKAMDLAVSLNVKLEETEDGSTINIEIEGENMGVLIGKRGQTLDSLQYLTSLIVNKEAGDKFYRVRLDTEDYRARRQATLENLARNIAKKVKRIGKPVALEPMNPYERRIIHSTLQNDKFCTTISEGEEPYRHVTVVLKNK